MRTDFRTDYDIPARVYPVIWMGLIKEGEHGQRIHPTQKPVKLLMNLLSDFSEKGDVILAFNIWDLRFTLMACEQISRQCMGIEIEPFYCDIIVERWELYTGKTATRVAADNDTVVTGESKK